jgi:ABC-type dipeptide/oligopeptide/nickel transport system permease component
MTLTGTRIVHYYWQIGVCVAVILGIVTIRQRERLPDRLLNLALLIVLWPLVLAVLLLVLLFVPDIFDRRTR